MRAKQKKTALVLGATGGVGGEVAKSLLKHGWAVKALARKIPEKAGGIRWVKGDAMDSLDVLKAAKGASLIVHAVNPPGYKKWPQLVMPMLEHTIEAARKNHARILLPGTIYNYGENTKGAISEDTPQRPSTRKGEIRCQMEERLRDVSEEGVPVLIVRCGDFFGPHPGNNWFSHGLIKAGQPVRSIHYPGKQGVGHAWAYLPDAAEAMVRLVEQEDRLGAFELFHFGGHFDKNGAEMTDAIRQVAGKPRIKVKPTPWPVLKTLSPFVGLFHEMMELRYLWEHSYRLDNNRLVEFLGEEPHTPLNVAVEETLRGLRCLPGTEAN